MLGLLCHLSKDIPASWSTPKCLPDQLAMLPGNPFPIGRSYRQVPMETKVGTPLAPPSAVESQMLPIERGKQSLWPLPGRMAIDEPSQSKIAPGENRHCLEYVGVLAHQRSVLRTLHELTDKRKTQVDRVGWMQGAQKVFLKRPCQLHGG